MSMSGIEIDFLRDVIRAMTIYEAKGISNRYAISVVDDTRVNPDGECSIDDIAGGAFRALYRFINDE